MRALRRRVPHDTRRTRQRDTRGPARLVTKHFTHERETFSPYRETCALGLYREGLRRYTMRWPVLGRWRVRVTPHITHRHSTRVLSPAP